jgi:hypothetical protein
MPTPRIMLINFMVGELQVEQYLTCINILQLIKFPFGTKLRLQIKQMESVIVEVTDRGPF